jgi:hypothetical protein|uniref:SOS-response transcriptional repressor n=1 Tax=Bacteriophage sp. TaxID=38018 RepID=A0A8D9PEQ6_9VIRU|nr:MAG TPA: SOS-response transcriptional repressor [Bacteriophage sp.]
MEKEAMKNFKNKLLGFWYYIKFYYIHPNKPYMDKLKRVSKVMKASPYSYKQWAEFLNISEKNVRKIIHKKYFLTCRDFMIIADKTNTTVTYLFQGKLK